MQIVINGKEWDLEDFITTEIERACWDFGTGEDLKLKLDKVTEILTKFVVLWVQSSNTDEAGVLMLLEKLGFYVEEEEEEEKDGLDKVN